MMEKIYDIVVWGASGFTGRLAVDYIYKNQKNSNVTWADWSVGGWEWDHSALLGFPILLYFLFKRNIYRHE